MGVENQKNGGYVQADLFAERQPAGFRDGRSGRVESQAAPQEEGQAPTARRREPCDGNALMEKVADTPNLHRAWERVKANKGCGGVDGETVGDFAEKADTRIREIQGELTDGSYKPSKVMGVQIPKPGGGVRQLGIPTVKDRVVQQAILQVMEPEYEAGFSESSYGFRPNRSAHGALTAGSAYVADGYGIVVDIDLERFFDRVNHDILMGRLARRIKDRRLLKLIRLFLRSGMMQDGVCVRRETGTPQGGNLSPLLANILLDELDKELERRGHRFCRYADDCNIYVRSQQAGERVMGSVRRFIETRLKLKVNDAKSKVAPSGECKFLGYTIGAGGRLTIAEQSLEKVRKSLRRMTARNRGREVGDIVEEVNTLLRGWYNYFRLAQARGVFAKLDGWLRRKLRCYRIKQCKRRIGIARFLMAEGVKEYQAWELAMSKKGWWRLSNTPQTNKAMGMEWFRKLVLFNLEEACRRVATPLLETARC